MEAALKTLPWVKDVKIAFEEKAADLTLEPDSFDEAALRKALEEAGFKYGLEDEELEHEQPDRKNPKVPSDPPRKD